MKKSVVKKKEERKEFDLEESFVLWRNTAKSGIHYLSGNLSDKLGKGKIVGYFSTNKKNPKEPDIRVYEIDSEGNQGREIVALWESISHNEKRYLTGISDDKEKIVAFYGDDKDEKRPYIRAYFKED